MSGIGEVGTEAQLWKVIKKRKLIYFGHIIRKSEEIIEGTSLEKESKAGSI